MAEFTLRTWNFRAIRALEWSPVGVCLLAGPNGSGKTSTLGALAFLRNAMLRGVQEAERFAEAGSAFRNFHSDPDADVVFEVELDGWRWRLEIPVEGSGVHAYNGEYLWHGQEQEVAVPRLQANFVLKVDGLQRGRDAHVAIRTLHTIAPRPDLGEFIEKIKAIRIYNSFNVKNVTQILDNQENAFLSPSGQNLVPVLKNWKGAPRRFNHQFEWVMGWAKRAFPGLIEDLEFSPDGTARFYPSNAPHPDISLPLSVAAEGLVTGLLQLTAVAGAKPGAIIAFDEMENQLHPHAIRTLLEAMREMADEKRLTIVLTTHSPVVMNEFTDREDQFYVLLQEPDGQNPRPLNALHHPAWLSHFALGDLYEREKIVPQRVVGGG